MQSIYFLHAINLRSTNTSIHRPNSTFMKRTLHYSGTILSNALPSNLRDSKNMDNLKKKYYEYFLLQQEQD